MVELETPQRLCHKGSFVAVVLCFVAIFRVAVGIWLTAFGAMGGCVASPLPCKNTTLKGEDETVQPAKMAGRVPGVTVSIEAVQMEIAQKGGSPSPLLEAVMAGRSAEAA